MLFTPICGVIYPYLWFYLPLSAVILFNPLSMVLFTLFVVLFTPIYGVIYPYLWCYLPLSVVLFTPIYGVIYPLYMLLFSLLCCYLPPPIYGVI